MRCIGQHYTRGEDLADASESQATDFTVAPHTHQTDHIRTQLKCRLSQMEGRSCLCRPLSSMQLSDAERGWGES